MFDRGSGGEQAFDEHRPVQAHGLEQGGLPIGRPDQRPVPSGAGGPADGPASPPARTSGGPWPGRGRFRAPART